MRPASTSCAPTQSTTTTLANTRKMAIAVRIARARIEVARGDECALDRGTETAVGQRLVGEGLQHAHRAEQFGCIGGGVGERVLRRTRAPAHRAAEAVERQDDHRDRREHKGGKPRARHHHHGARAHEQDDVAQRNGNRGTHRGLDLRGVGGEPRDQFAGLGRIEVGGRERDQMAEHALAQIGHDPFAQRGDEIKTRRARQSEHGHDPRSGRRNSCRSGSHPLGANPKSIIRRTAIGTTRVVIAAMTRTTSAAIARQR